MGNCIDGGPGHIWTGLFEIDRERVYFCGCGGEDWEAGK